MRASILPVDVPDPMHPDPSVDQDEPLATDRHHLDQHYVTEALIVLLGPDHYVTRDRWLRMDPRNPTDRLLPDLLIALDLPPEIRDPDEYDPQQMGKAPDLLAEYLSPSSVKADIEDKPLRYAQLGVREYFLFDVDGTYGVPLVQGWRLARDGSRERLPIDREGGVTSEVIPVRFVVADHVLRVIDVRTGELALRYGEYREALAHEQAELQRQAEARQRAEREREREAELRQRAESEVERLRAELDRLRRRFPGE